MAPSGCSRRSLGGRHRHRARVDGVRAVPPGVVRSGLVRGGLVLDGLVRSRGVGRPVLPVPTADVATVGPSSDSGAPCSSGTSGRPVVSASGDARADEVCGVTTDHRPRSPRCDGEGRHETSVTPHDRARRRTRRRAPSVDGIDRRGPSLGNSSPAYDGRIVSSTWSLPLRGAQRGVPPVRHRRRVEQRRGRRPHRRPEHRVHGGRRPVAPGQRAEHPRLGPHAVRDRARHPERLRGEGVHVDRVHVARDRGVAPADVPGHLPHRVRPVPDDGCGLRRRRLRRVVRRGPAHEVRRAGVPGALAVGGVDRRDEVDLRALGVGDEPLGVHLQRQRFADLEGPPLGDDVAQVHHARRGQGELAVGHQPHLQRERQHVRVGQRHVGADGEPAHVRVVRHRVRVDGRAGELQRPVGQRVPARARGEQRPPVERPQRRGRVQRLGTHRRAPLRSVSGRHYAPSRFWPSTRSTWPLTAYDAPCAK